MPHAPVLRVGLFAGPMPKGLKRYYGQHHLYFITCSCYRRKTGSPAHKGAATRPFKPLYYDEHLREERE